jgi:hypothetical protein
MGNLIAQAVVPLIFKGASAKAIAAVGTGLNVAGIAGASSAVTASVMKGAAPKPPATPTQISQAPTVIAAGEQAKKYEGDNQMDLLSTIIAGQDRRKNKLG